MQRYILNLNGIPYLVEYTKSTDMSIKHVEEYVMLRKYEIENDISIDKEILFIPQSKFKNIVKKNDESVLYQNPDLVYPYNNGNYETFTSNIFDFASNSSLQSLKYVESNDIEFDLNYDYYNLLNKSNSGEFKIAQVECDRVRIYKPHERKHIDSIISVSNIINGIKFNYFCELYKDQEIKVGTEITENNNRYYEYIEIFVPNTQSFFGSHNIYYNEDLNFFQTVKFANNELESKIVNIDNNQTLLRTLILPYSITKACDKNIKCETCPINLLYQGTLVHSNEVDDKYLEFDECPLISIKDSYVKSYLTDDIDSVDYSNSDYNYVNIPFVLTLSHYDDIDETSNHYLSTNGISPSSIVFSQDNQFVISSKITFDKYNRSVISVVNEWKYPEVRDTSGNIMKLQDAYFYFNKITNKSEYFKFEGYDDEIFLDNFSDELTESMTFTLAGCVIEMAIDIQFKNIFYRQIAGMDDGIDDFTFNLDNIFSTWKEYPEIIFVRTFFIDKFLSKVFYSNVMPLTKEKFKYCINETENQFRLNLKNVKDMKFIDKINCSIRKYDILKENIISSGSTSGKSSIIYKTVFYKTHDAQKIKIRQGVVQNIGINLGDYLTKVEDFKMVIESYEFVEYGRNDVYVIFKIPGTYLTSASGKYDIVDASDDTYITSGDYELV